MRLDVLESDIRALDSPGYFVCDGVLGPEAARAIHAEAHRIAHTAQLHPAKISREAKQEQSLRNDLITWIQRESAGPVLIPLLDLFDSLRNQLNETAWLGLGRYDVQLALYPGGGARYVRHLDTFRAGAAANATPSSNRRLTAIYYANPEWMPEQGGALRVFHEDGSTREVEPVLDRLIVFLSDRLEHEVLPANAERLALTAWFYGR